MEKNDKIIQNIKNRYEIVGNSEGLLRALEIALMVASRDLSVLIIGESGVGKEVIPRIIHDNSARKHNKYFAINCGSIPEGTIDSELFGHAKGAFTGAIGEREGYFGAANGGTLFLDEVGELPLSTQARLLRVLETGEYIRVGENTVKKTNVRIVAATNVNMQKAISEGKFRADLFYRLNTIPIHLPPLRERGRDVELLFRKFALDIADKYHCEPIRLSTDAKELLLKYTWPGNIRQLRNLTEQLSAMYAEQEISSDILTDFGITDDSNKGGTITVSVGNNRDESIHLYSKEREHIFGSLKVLSEEVTELKKLILELSRNDTYRLPASGVGLTNPGIQALESDNEDIETMIAEEDIPAKERPLTRSEREKQDIIRALERNRNNRRKTALELEMSERTLYRKIEKYNLEKRFPKDTSED